MFDESEDLPETMKMPNLYVSHRFTEAENLISPVPVSEPEPAPDGFPLKTVCIACVTDLRFGASGWGTDYCKKRDSLPCTRIRPRLGLNLHIR